MTDIMTDIIPYPNDDDIPARLVEETRAILENIWQIASDLPAEQQTAMTEYVSDLFQIVTEDMLSEIDAWRDTARANAAAAREFLTQRDAALDELHRMIVTREDRHNIIMNIMRQYDLSQPDAERLLDFLQGTSELEETMRYDDKLDFNDALRKFVTYLYEEQIWRADMDAEYEAEREAELRRIDGVGYEITEDAS